ncbi:gamma-glutamyl-gamma-aminobutyrate hydrolase family protein [Paracoccaceae bacterium]|nr:gamma-glutamyl-gamma-aminobutyrate hydrolase family protein [Paracoccaceae bacterium]
MILISTRVDYHVPSREYRSALDLNWARVCDIDLLPVSCITEPEIILDQVRSVDGIILSGGNDVSENSSDTASSIRSAYDKKLLSLAVETGIPIFGVCFGLQLIGSIFGGRLDQTEGHVSTYHEVQLASQTSANLGYPQRITVNSYHDFSLSGPFRSTSKLKPLYFDSDGNIEAVTANDGTIMGTMWHPERQMADMCPVFSKWIERLK